MADHPAGLAGLSVARWVGHDVAVGDQGLAFLLCGCAQFTQADVKRVAGVVTWELDIKANRAAPFFW